MIEIVVVSYSNEVPAVPLAARFDHQGGAIGRSADSQLVLPDPKHHVSRLQARVTSEGDRHRITNLSQANPTLLNGVELPCDEPHVLRVGDEIQIGLYVLSAQAPASTASTAGAIAARDALAAASREPLHAARSLHGAAPASIASATGHVAAVTTAAPTALASIATDAHPDAQQAGAQALLQAFLDGAGIPSITLSSGLTPELMEMIGSLLASAIDGTIDLIGLRALVKREAQADVTMVVVRNNNPLKFLPDGPTVLTQMLRKRMPGFMGPLEAMQDAYEDLHAHQLGMVAGMQAAQQSLHRQLSPDAVTDAAGAPSRMAQLIPVQRKAQLWDSYCALHRQLAASVQEDAPVMTGTAFRQAYEAESERYKDEVADGR